MTYDHFSESTSKPTFAAGKLGLLPVACFPEDGNASELAPDYTASHSR
jgi:hypothetical protein